MWAVEVDSRAGSVNRAPVQIQVVVYSILGDIWKLGEKWRDRL